MTVIDTPEGISFTQLLVFRSRLKIEMETKMRSRVNTLQAFNRRFGTSHKTRAAALKDCEQRIAEASHKHDEEINLPD